MTRLTPARCASNAETGRHEPPRGRLPDALSRRALNLAAGLWFVITLAGQWLFTAYSIIYYGGLLWTEGAAGLVQTGLPRAYTPGDTWGNGAIAVHLLLVVFILGTGPLQLVPALRQRFPRFHRWNGRGFVAAAVVSALTGLYLIWIRGYSAGDRPQHFGLSLNGALILVCSFLTVRHALGRRIDLHQRWALRLYLVASGVWFARVGLWLWVLLSGGAGIDFTSFTGPFLTALSFGQTLLPLALLELYLHTKDRAQGWARPAMVALLLLLSVGTAIGLHQVYCRVWLPRM